MDASLLKAAATTTIHVKNAAGEPLYDGENPVQIVLHSPGSRAFATVESRQTARVLKRLNENDGKMTAATAEERRSETAQDLSDVTVSFNNLTHGDKTGAALFAAVYEDPDLGFITAQVAKAVKDWSNFLPKSPVG